MKMNEPRVIHTWIHTSSGNRRGRRRRTPVRGTRPSNDRRSPPTARRNRRAPRVTPGGRGGAPVTVRDLQIRFIRFARRGLSALPGLRTLVLCTCTFASPAAPPATDNNSPHGSPLWALMRWTHMLPPPLHANERKRRDSRPPPRVEGRRLGKGAVVAPLPTPPNPHNPHRR